MTRTQHNVPSKVAERLAELASDLRELVYGEAGCPKWGTAFHDIETQGMEIGLEMARLFMEQTVGEQARDGVPAEFLQCDGETAQQIGVQHEARIETPAGEIAWEQPKTRLKQARRDFFPSGQSARRGR